MPTRGGEQPKPPRAAVPTRSALAARAPWLPPAYELADVTALQALERGNASPEQQRRALGWVINLAAGTYDLAYRPGLEGARDTDFALGRQFVGQQIVKLLNLLPSALPRREPQADPPEPGRE